MNTTISSSRNQLLPEVLNGQLLVATLYFTNTPDAVALTGDDASNFDVDIIDGVGHITLRSDANPDFESNLSYNIGIEVQFGTETEVLSHTVPIQDLIEVHEGTAAADTIIGTRGEDYINAGAGDDVLEGGERDDWFVGGEGADTHRGDDGFDTVDYRYSAQAVDVNLETGTGAGGSAEGDTYNSVERIFGSINHDDTLTGSTKDDKLYGLGGDDTLVGGNGEDYLDGGAGADVLNGGSSRDTVHYGESDTGVDVNLQTGAGQGGHAEGDTLISIEKLHGSAFNDTFTGSKAEERFYGEAGDDVISAGGGDDLLDGGAGADYLDGGDGIDRTSYALSDSAIFIDLEEGTASGGLAEGDTLVSIETIEATDFDDTLLGSSGYDILSGLDGTDILDGRAGDDVLSGGSGDDQVTGGEGKDLLYGNSGNDILNGGEGNDKLYGDSGNLLSNGSFEDIPVAPGQTALELNVEGWDTDQSVTFWRSGHEGVAGDDGAVYLQLDARDASEGVEEIGQTVDTQAGQLHQLSFAIALQPGADPASSAIEVLLDGNVVATVTPASEEWEQVALDITPASSSSAISFREVAGQSDGSGALLDNVLLMPAGNDVLSGGDGDDRLYGDLGADTLDGGEGVDDARYEDSVAGVDVDLARGTGLGGFAEGDTYNSIERVYGAREYDDVLSGTDSGDEQLYGLGGDDVISGRGGNDVLGGGEGNDTISGGDGNDTIAGDQGDDVITAGNGNDKITAGEGADTVDGGNGVDTIDYRGSTGAINIALNGQVGSGGFAEGDTLTGIERIYGSESGSDIIGGSDGRDRIYGEGGDDALFGGGGKDYISGGDGNDTLDGGDGDDVLQAGSGDDVLRGGAGADVFNGGDGEDTADYSAETGAFSINVDDITQNTGAAAGDTYISIERFFGSSYEDGFLGSAGADKFYGNGGDDVIDGGDGDDYLSGGDGDDIIEGGVGRDTLVGGDGNNILNGGNGNDLFYAGSGVDTIDGGGGFDTVNYTGSSTSITLNLETGAATGDAVGDTFVSIERFFGSKLDDTFTGSSEDDRLYGDDGADTIYGGSGNDFLSGGSGDDFIYGQDGQDTIIGGSGDDVIAGDGSNDILFGWGGQDTLYGGYGDDVIDGGYGQDTIYGNFGNDTLTGSYANDTFVFDDNWGADTVTDFENNGFERLDFSAVTGVSGISDLTITDDGQNAMVSYSGNSVLLNDVLANELTEDSFIF